MRESKKALAIRPSLLLFCCLVLAPMAVQSDEERPSGIGVIVEWYGSSEPDIVGYNVYVGTQSGAYNRVVDAGLELFARIPVDPGITYYFSITARTADELESPFSDEIVFTVPIDGIRATFTPLTITVAAETPAKIEFSAQAGFRYLVQATEDLSNWQTLETFIPDVDGSIAWEDPEAFLRERRFYRVIAVSLPENEIDGRAESRP